MGVVLEMTDEAVSPAATNSADTAGDNSTVAQEQIDADASAGTGQEQTEQTQGTEAVASTTAAVQKEAQPAKDWEQESRRYQSERDRLEQYAKELVKKVSPFVELDEWGNVKGPKAQPQAQPQIQQETKTALDVEQLLDSAVSGDKEALKGLLWISKEQARREAQSELSQDLQKRNQSYAETEAIKKEFPDLYKLDNDGLPVKTALLDETVKVLTQRRLSATDPQHIRIAALEAENRLIKAGLPALEKSIKENTLNKAKQVGAGGTAVSSGQSQTGDDLKGVLTNEQEAQLTREGVTNPAERQRIAKMVKQAKKEGGFYL